MPISRIPEIVVDRKRLGRHIHHDPQSKAYPFKATGAPLESKRWSKDSDFVLDQGDIGSCTGNATVGALLCSNDNPLKAALSVAQINTLNEDLAVKIYTIATETDPIPGTYPQEDTGSDGLDAAKAAKTLGYISGYTHAFGLQDVLAALQHGPVIIGIEWTTGFDSPDAHGRVHLTNSVRGGHEICLDEIDVENRLVWFRNSWSVNWGVNGRACMSWDDLDVLLKNQGDATVFVALSQPAPVPTPTPTPQPAPTPTPDPGTEDSDLAAAAHEWLKQHHRGQHNVDFKAALQTWLEAKGL